MKNKFFAILICMLLLLANVSYARGADSKNINHLIRKAISKSYGGARIELTGPIQWNRGELPKSAENLSEVLFLDDDARGKAHFSIHKKSADRRFEGWVSFSAWLPSKVALRRIHPGEVLRPDMFSTREINVSTGLGHEYRGVILPETTSVTGFEATQTLLEGQFVVSSAIRKTPDIRRGDSVRIHLISGGLTLTTLGTAEEPSYINRQVRVMTAKGKRELLGQLQTDRIVVVNL